MFIKKVEKELFHPKNVSNVRKSFARDERNALTEIKKMEK